MDLVKLQWLLPLRSGDADADADVDADADADGDGGVDGKKHESRSLLSDIRSNKLHLTRHTSQVNRHI